MMQQRDSQRVFISGSEDLHVTNFIGDSTTLCISNKDNEEDIREFVEWKIEAKLRERQLTENEYVLQDIKRKLNERAHLMSVIAPMTTVVLIHILIFKKGIMGEHANRRSLGRVFYG
ncbi:hypothetical protein J3459_003868 [Metarhizium acridum]|uniref:uncharacterized protein n=1 Tax=Metarhizium acridum TaxID=92637 RepID=UPI001C6AC083|nr:hypothetical protein J3458_002805 [Metarhizium acridum]KAG8428504.1 hypothetical protein J3459_003868 [Metarhizium acridum]